VGQELLPRALRRQTSPKRYTLHDYVYACFAKVGAGTQAQAPAAAGRGLSRVAWASFCFEDLFGGMRLASARP
jgi:hypothetical protein